MNIARKSFVVGALAISSLFVGASVAGAEPGAVNTYKSNSGATGNASYGTGSGYFRARMICTNNGLTKFGNTISEPGLSKYTCGPQGLGALTAIY